MPSTTVRLTALLGQIVGGLRQVEVEALTVGGALDAVFVAYPALRVHVLDESGAIRPHVTCFHNDAAVRDAVSLKAALQEGDPVTVLHAVSGGMGYPSFEAEGGHAGTRWGACPPTPTQAATHLSGVCVLGRLQRGGTIRRRPTASSTTGRRRSERWR